MFKLYRDGKRVFRDINGDQYDPERVINSRQYEVYETKEDLLNARSEVVRKQKRSIDPYAPSLQIQKINRKPRQRTRMSGDLLSEIKGLADKQVAEEMFEEEMRQLGVAEAIHGRKELAAYLDPTNPSRTVEQQIGKQLVMDGVVPQIIPADRILGENITAAGLGVDGIYKPDSEVRRHVRGGMVGDDLELDRTDVRTEFLSPRGRSQTYEDWKPGAFMGNDSLVSFNRAVSEYYGQQALKLRGATAVPDDMRAHQTRKANERGKLSTVGSDRLIENSRTLTDADTAQSADFRYLDEEGRLVVADNQAGDLTPDNIINFNLLKKSNLNLRDIGAGNFKTMLAGEAQRLKAAGLPHTLDDIFGQLIERGELAPLAMRQRDTGTRAGKVLSGQPIMGEANFDDQHRYQKLLYPVQAKGAMYKDEGYLPEKFKMFDTAKASKAIGDILANPNADPSTLNFFQQGGKLSAALRTLNNSSGEGYLKDRSLNKQFSEGYSFGNNETARMAGTRPIAIENPPMVSGDEWYTTGSPWDELPF